MSKKKEIKNKVDGYSKKLSKLNEFRDLIPRDNMSRLENTVKTFERDAETAIDENRLMRIGVIGQIKRGKSSFLNTFLFDGDEVLPKAATPMTAALTKITYSEKPKATVEFFSKDEWDNIETLAREKEELEEKNRRIREERKKIRNKLSRDNKPIEQIQEPTQEQNSSLELVEMARKGGINYQEYLGKEKTIEAASREDLVGKLNDFVGAQGKYTPIVKSSQLALNIPALKHVEIVDTPGMNDPIISRARKTEDFIGQCDVIFFLSYCSQFLDSTDMGLLAQNIPSRGIRNIILIGSLFDGVLLEEYEKYNDIGTAIRDLTERKEKEARNNFDRVKDKIQKETLKEALEKSFPPVFISSRCSDIAKHYSNLSEEEAHTLNRLNEMFDDFTFTPEMLSNLANMEEVGERYDRVKKDKDSILAERF
ncbi:MAG: dynamin family protein, partial [bacterium]